MGASVYTQGQNAFEKQWCGNSKVDVEIQTGKNGEVKTRASIVVPQNLKEVTNYSEETALINKTEQGLIMTLDGKANAAHLGKIYNYDEDDNTNIFIPYLYMSSASRNLNNIDINMARTFKGNTEETFTIVPINDAFGTPLCECQREMLLEKIQQNLVRRNAVLSEIAKNIVFHMNTVAEQNAQIKKWSNAKADESHLKSLNKQLALKIVECQTFVKKIEKLNSDIKDNENQLQEKQQEGQKKQAEIRHSEYRLRVFRGKFWGKQTVKDAADSRGPKKSKSAAQDLSYFLTAASQGCEAAHTNTVSLDKLFPREELSHNGSYSKWATQMNQIQRQLVYLRNKVTLDKVDSQVQSEVSKLTTLKNKFDEIYAAKRN